MHGPQKRVDEPLITLTVNGERIQVNRDTTIADLLKRFGLTPGQVAVERNLQVVPRSDFAAVVLGEGDTLEIVHFVGGG